MRRVAHPSLCQVAEPRAHAVSARRRPGRPARQAGSATHRPGRWCCRSAWRSCTWGRSRCRGTRSAMHRGCRARTCRRCSTPGRRWGRTRTCRRGGGGGQARVGQPDGGHKHARWQQLRWAAGGSGGGGTIRGHVTSRGRVRCGWRCLPGHAAGAHPALRALAVGLSDQALNLRGSRRGRVAAEGLQRTSDWHSRATSRASGPQRTQSGCCIGASPMPPPGWRGAQAMRGTRPNHPRHPPTPPPTGVHTPPFRQAGLQLALAKAKALARQARARMARWDAAMVGLRLLRVVCQLL